MKKRNKIMIILLIIIGITVIILSIYNKYKMEKPKQIVNQFISIYNNKDIEKILEYIDFVGAINWGYDEVDFSDDDFKEFQQDYQEQVNDRIEIEFTNEYKNDIEKSIKSDFEDINNMYKLATIKIDNFKKVQQIGDNLFVVKATLSATTNSNNEKKEEFDSWLETFIIYKNKIIYVDEFIDF